MYILNRTIQKKIFENTTFSFVWVVESQVILFFSFLLYCIFSMFYQNKCFPNFVWLKNEIYIRNKRRRSNSPGCHPILYNPGVLQNHPDPCWQLVQMSGMRVTGHLCPRESDGWAHKQPALYFIYLYFDKAIFPVIVLMLFC